MQSSGSARAFRAGKRTSRIRKVFRDYRNYRVGAEKPGGARSIDKTRKITSIRPAPRHSAAGRRTSPAANSTCRAPILRTRTERNPPDLFRVSLAPFAGGLPVHLGLSGARGSFCRHGPSWSLHSGCLCTATQATPPLRIGRGGLDSNPSWTGLREILPGAANSGCSSHALSACRGTACDPDSRQADKSCISHRSCRKHYRRIRHM